MILRNINNFNLCDTVTCGQIFRYYIEEDNSYTIILSDRVINIKQIDNTLIVDSNNLNDLENIIYYYFDLSRNYDIINEKLIKNDPKIKDVVNKCKGLKMIKQEPIETIIEYIISSNNSVSSIRNSLNLLSSKYGKKISFRNKDYYLFPTLDELIKINESEFRNFKVGFRDKYLINAISNIYNKNLDIDIINDMTGNEALDYLMKNKGIGPKVASCILLFSYHKFDVFPVDTWVKKFMLEDYNIKGQDNIMKFAKDTYKDNSGIAIQYMFHAKRNK